MQFLLLWSGHKRDMRKATIPAIENKIGLVGHWRDGKVWLPDPEALQAAIPSRYRKAYDAAINWHGLPQTWCDERSNDAPLAIHLNRSGKRYKKHLITLYLQPIKES